MLDPVDRLNMIKHLLEKDVLISSEKSKTLTLKQLLLGECHFSKTLKSIGRRPIRLGQGTYGSVDKVCLEKICDYTNSVAIKRSEISFTSNILQQSLDPTSTYNSEVAIFRLLQQFILTHQTPHIPIYIGDFICPDYQTILKKDPRNYSLKNDRYIITELAIGNINLRDLISTESFDLTKLYLFQIIWTLGIINNTYPNFRHNDLNTLNVLIFRGPREGHSIYKWSDDIIFKTPNLGSHAALWDFASSIILNDIDNIHAINMSTDNVGVGIFPNPIMDIVKILLLFRENILIYLKKKIDEGFFVDIWNPILDFIEDIIPLEFFHHYEFIINPYRTPIFEWVSDKTYLDLLKHKIFSEYRIKEAPVQHKYMYTRKNPASLSPLNISENHNIIMSYKPVPRCSNYSMAYLVPKEEKDTDLIALRCLVDYITANIRKVIHSQQFAKIPTHNYMSVLASKLQFYRALIFPNLKDYQFIINLEKVCDIVIQYIFKYFEVTELYCNGVVAISYDMAGYIMLGFHLWPSNMLVSFMKKEISDRLLFRELIIEKSKDDDTIDVPFDYMSMQIYKTLYNRGYYNDLVKMYRYDIPHIIETLRNILKEEPVIPEK